jgi:hypothetical protein
MGVRTQRAIVSFAFVCFVWLLITALEPLAKSQWLGPVPGENLRRGFDAGALFYTEVNLADLELRSRTRHRNASALGEGLMERVP